MGQVEDIEVKYRKGYRKVHTKAHNSFHPYYKLNFYRNVNCIGCEYWTKAVSVACFF